MTDLTKHGKPPVRVELVARSHGDFLRFQQWYLNSPYFYDSADPSYGSGYDLVRHNCAHSILNILRAFGYEVAIAGEARSVGKSTEAGDWLRYIVLKWRNLSKLSKINCQTTKR